jgi:8-oxo-dGTP pyrophosphatase MutT (NUDIX family)
MKRKAKIVFTVQQGTNTKILLGERITSESTFWWLPGGSVDPGESDFEAVARELSEELTLPPSYQNKVDAYLQSKVSPKRLEYQANAFVILFKVLLDEKALNEIPLILDEFNQMRWFNISELPTNMSREFEFVEKDFSNWITSTN